jgi:hypothetical protein
VRYDITEHPLLSGKVTALQGGENGEEAFQAHEEMAEAYLQLATGELYTGDRGVLVQHFLALQVNWQVEVGIDAHYLRSISSDHTKQSKVFKDVPIINPAVSAGFFALMRTWGYGRTVRSIRG